MIGGTKQGEYARSLELFEEIFTEQGVYFALAFLHGLGYTREDIRAMMGLQRESDKRRAG